MQRKDLLVAAGVTAVLSLGWYQFVWQAQGASADKASREAQSGVESTTKLKTQLASLERTKSDLASKAALKDQLDKAIPATPDVSTLVKELQAMATQHGVILTMITNGGLTVPEDPNAVAAAAATPTTVAGKPAVAAPTTGGPATEMLVTLAMNGDYTKIVSFVNDLAALPRLVVVDSLSLNPAQSAQVPGKAVATGSSISATIVARVFTTAKPATGAAATPGATLTPSTTAPAAGPTTTTATKGGL